MKIRIVSKNVGESAVIQMIDNTLEGMQKVLNGGYLEVVGGIRGLAPNLHAYCDEEGKLKGLTEHMPLHGGADYLCGPVLISASDADGEEIGLTEADATAVAQLLNDAAKSH